MQIRVAQRLDDTGRPEEFTWDLFPIIDASLTTHLRSDGLPAVGTHITPGMIVVGKIGRSATFDAARQPTPLEIHGLAAGELRSRYGHMWRDTSYYAAPEEEGVVLRAGFTVEGGTRCALVEIGSSSPSLPRIQSKAREEGS